MNKPSCFGNFANYNQTKERCVDDNNCKFKWKCIDHQNIIEGECDCKYKVCCHVGRQHVRNMFPEVEPNIEDCWFYQSFERQLTEEEKEKYPWKED
jgi:hypothetical protein